MYNIGDQVIVSIKNPRDELEVSLNNLSGVVIKKYDYSTQDYPSEYVIRIDYEDGSFDLKRFTEYELLPGICV